jgi:putative ABC transport system permease protein
MKQILNFVLMNLKRRKLRSYLTIIGIIVGVIAIVSLMSLSEGLKTGIADEFSKTGALKITITSKYAQFGQVTDKGLTTDDVREIERIQEIDFVTGNLNIQSLSKFSRTEKFITINAYDIRNYERILKQDGKELLRGKIIDSDKEKQVVIGFDLFNSDEFFGKEIKIGDSIDISNQKFKVIGVLKDTGNKGQDRQVYISLDNLREISNIPEKQVDVIFAVVKENADVEDTAKKIEDRLERSRKDDDVIVTTAKKAAEDREDTLKVVSIIVIGIAAISLLVGGIGILNSMYTSVLERKKEIGIMKAIGAKREDILKIFLLESGIIGLIGGIIGIIGGFLISFMVYIIGNFTGTEIAVSFDISIIIIALSFSFLLGLLAGFLPAYQASKQQAIDSLREE